MSYYPPDDENQSTKRINIRLPRVQYERLMMYGKILGLEGDTAVLKHFISFALQMSASQFSSIIMQEEAGKNMKSLFGSIEGRELEKK